MEALQRLHNRGSISTGYDVTHSLKFETDNTEYLMAEGRPQGNQQTWTYSCWLKRTEVDNGVVAQHIFSAGSDGKLAVYFRDDASYPDDRIFIYIDEGNSLKWIGQVNQSFRDTSAWYHFVFTCDSTDSTAADRTKLYINGVQQTITFNSTLNANVSTRVGDSGGKFAIGGKVSDTSYGFNGYISECVLVDGSALTPTSFGEYDDDSGIWKPKDVSSLSLGTAGFYMNFDDSSNVGAVQTGTSQGNFDKYNLTSADQATDTPTNNFCTFNPLQTVRVNTGDSHKWTIRNGATSAIQAADYGYMTHAGNMGFKKGKWYAEFKAGTGTVQAFVGMNQLDNTGAWEESYIGAYSNATAIGMCKSQDGYFYRNGGGGALGVSWAAGDILGIAIRINDDGTGFMGMSKNGTWENSQDPSSGTSGMLGLYYGNALPANLFHSFAVSTRRNNGAMLANFGGFPGFTISSANSDAKGYGSFEYAVPTGYYALCTKNLEEFG